MYQLEFLRLQLSTRIRESNSFLLLENVALAYVMFHRLQLWDHAFFHQHLHPFLAHVPKLAMPQLGLLGVVNHGTHISTTRHHVERARLLTPSYNHSSLSHLLRAAPKCRGVIVTVEQTYRDPVPHKLGHMSDLRDLSNLPV